MPARHPPPGLAADAAACVSVMCLVLMGETLLARTWTSLGVFSQLNVIFDADASVNRSDFASGLRFYAVNHPLLPYAFAPLIRLIAALASAAGLHDADTAFREDLALYVAPLCAAMKAGCFYAAFRAAGARIGEAILETLVCALAFSSVIFGATPSTYGVTGWLLSVAALVAVLSFGRPVLSGWIPWTLIGVVASGMTISNVIHVGFMHAASLAAHGTSIRRSASKAVGVAGAALLLTFSLSLLLAARRGELSAVKDSAATWTSFRARFTPQGDDQIDNVLRFPSLLGRTFVPTPPMQVVNKRALFRGSAIRFELTYNRMEFGWPSVALTVVGLFILAGGVVAYRLGAAWRWVGVASAASVVTYGGLYSVFGLNTFLYSQCWQVPAMMLVAAWCRLLGDRSRTGLALVLGATVTVLLIGDFAVIRGITADVTSAAAGR